MLLSVPYSELPVVKRLEEFLFNSSLGHVDTDGMDERDPIISVLCEEIDDKEVLKAVIDKHEKTGQSLYSILKEESASVGLDEEQLTKIIAASNQIEFVNLSADMVDPIAAHMVPAEMVNQHNVIPVKKDDDRLFVAMSEPLSIVVRDQIEMRTG